MCDQVLISRPDFRACGALALGCAVVACRADDDLTNAECITQDLAVCVGAVAVEDRAHVVNVEHLIEKRFLDDQCQVVIETVTAEALNCVLDVLDRLGSSAGRH